MGLDHGLRQSVAEPRDIWDEDNKPTDEESARYWADWREWRERTEIITWRKENHIHAWFGQNVQNGVDECEDAVVSRERLAKFVEVCEEIVTRGELIPGQVYNGQSWTQATGWVTNWVDGEVLNEDSIKLAEALMPTQSGFFFGSTGYDHWYFKALVGAIETLKPVLEKMGQDDTVVYWASW